MSKTIYLGHFCETHEKRIVSPAGTTMMEYVINVLEKIRGNLIIISPAQAKHNIPKKIIKNNAKRLIYLPSYKNDNIFLKIINRWRRKHDLYKELNNTLADGDTLIVYHSLAYIDVLRKIRSRKRINLILQVCEIYADVLEDEQRKKKEIQWIKEADKYIFSTEKLEEILNVENKDFTICMGVYNYNDSNYIKLFDDGLIHVVYAGTFDPRKGGAAAAAAAAGYLNNKYHLHILGFGSEEQISNIKSVISEISKKCNSKVTYDGLKEGNEYINFIKSCHIGLSTQNPESSFNETSFPSKILSYLSNGLCVVSIKIPAVENSAIGKDIYYYEKQTPEEIANAIISVDLSEKYDSKKILNNLDECFYLQLKKIL